MSLHKLLVVDQTSLGLQGIDAPLLLDPPHQAGSSRQDGTHSTRDPSKGIGPEGYKGPRRIFMCVLPYYVTLGSCSSTLLLLLFGYVHTCPDPADFSSRAGHYT